MRRTFVTVLSFLLCVSVALSFGAKGAFAEESTAGYKYTVKIYAGNHGGFGGEKEWSASYTYGDSVNISLAEAGFAVTNARYRVIGVRLTGLDDIYASGDENLTFSVEKIDRDMSFVVAYAMSGEVVEYTVRFVDENGADLTSPVTYHGMVGDAIVMDHLYFEGYSPVASSVEYIISADPAQNDFVIGYKKIPAPVVHTAGGGGGDDPASSSSGQSSASSQNASKESGSTAAPVQQGSETLGSGTQTPSQGTSSQDTAQAGTQQQGGTAQQQGGTSQQQGGSSSATQMGTSQRGGGMPPASKIALGLSFGMLLAAVIASYVLRKKNKK